jgi:hypothetical protein
LTVSFERGTDIANSILCESTGNWSLSVWLGG